MARTSRRASRSTSRCTTKPSATSRVRASQLCVPPLLLCCLRWVYGLTRRLRRSPASAAGQRHGHAAGLLRRGVLRGARGVRPVLGHHLRRPRLRPVEEAGRGRRGCATPITWTIIKTDGPNHHGLRCYALPGHQNGPNHLGLCALRPGGEGHRPEDRGDQGERTHSSS